MKALTLYDPWATLVVLGKKQYETRSWATNYRGPLYIHTSKKPMSRYEKQLCRQEPYASALAGIGAWMWGGHIIGKVWLLDCIPTERALSKIGHDEREFGDYGLRRYAWELVNPLRFTTPVPCTGHLGLWTLPLELEGAVAAQAL